MNRPIARCRKAASRIVSSRILGDVGATASVFSRRLVAATTTVVVLSLPVLSIATPDVGEKDNGWSKLDERALHVYVDCWDEFKARCGRNIVDDGLASGDPPSEAQVKEWTATMDRWLHPVVEEPVAVVSPDIVAPAPSATVAPASTGGCTGMEAESGSEGYSAVNPTSGAYGCYQILPSTSAAHGCDLSTPAGQDACAASICATEGPGAWAASGVSPC